MSSHLLKYSTVTRQEIQALCLELLCFVLFWVFFLHSSSQGVGACKIIKCDYNMTTYITNGPLLY